MKSKHNNLRRSRNLKKKILSKVLIKRQLLKRNQKKFKKNMKKRTSTHKNRVKLVNRAIFKVLLTSISSMKSTEKSENLIKLFVTPLKYLAS